MDEAIKRELERARETGELEPLAREMACRGYARAVVEVDGKPVVLPADTSIVFVKIPQLWAYSLDRRAEISAHLKAQTKDLGIEFIAVDSQVEFQAIIRQEKKKRPEGYCNKCGEPKEDHKTMCEDCCAEYREAIERAGEELLFDPDGHRQTVEAIERQIRELGINLNPANNPSSMGAAAMRGITAEELRTIPNILESHPELLGAFEREHPLRRFEQEYPRLLCPLLEHCPREEPKPCPPGLRAGSWDHCPNWEEAAEAELRTRVSEQPSHQRRLLP